MSFVERVTMGIGQSTEPFSMREDLISVIEAARQLERGKSTVFKVMKRLGIHAQKRRDSSSGNQLVSYITDRELQRVRDALHARRAVESENDDGELSGDDFISAEIGVFYLIRLEPSHDPLRFKVGFAANLNERLRALRCSAPFAVVVKSWPCRRLWEKTAIDFVTFRCERVHTEVFRYSSLEEVSTKCERFFALAPPVK